MAIVLKRLPEQGQEMLEQFLAHSIYGNCYHFAIALHRGLEWPLVGVIEKGNIVHAGVKSPGGKIWDGRGEITAKEFSEPFSNGIPDVCLISETELMDTGKVREHMVKIYLEKAQLVWPDLPWKIETIWQRIAAFSKELEVLSRKHRFWICASHSTAIPVLFQGQDDEKGYEVCPSIDGNSFTINRKLR